MKNYFTIAISLTVIGTCMYITACKTKKEAAAKTGCASSPTYTADIKSILDGNCLPCHSAEHKKHGVDISSYETAKAAAAYKNFLGSIKREDGFVPMHARHDKLDDATIEKISCWVQNGMPK